MIAGTYFCIFICFCPGIQVDAETVDPTEASDDVKSKYDLIRDETTNFLSKWLDPQAPLQETYPVPSIECDGKK